LLHAAVWAGREDLADLLRKEGARTDLKDSAGRTAEELAAELREMPLTPAVEINTKMPLTPTAETKLKEKSGSQVSTTGNTISDEEKRLLNSCSDQPSVEGPLQQVSHANEQLFIVNRK